MESMGSPGLLARGKRRAIIEQLVNHDGSRISPKARRQGKGSDRLA